MNLLSLTTDDYLTIINNIETLTKEYSTIYDELIRCLSRSYTIIINPNNIIENIAIEFHRSYRNNTITNIPEICINIEIIYAEKKFFGLIRKKPISCYKSNKFFIPLKALSHLKSKIKLKYMSKDEIYKYNNFESDIEMIDFIVDNT